jgi:hypothetical protein
VPPGWHSHKVRVANDIMVVNHERQGTEGVAEFGGGLGIYDVSKPSNPKLISKWRTHGKGVHRYDFDGRYAYISPTAEGYIGNICMILDLKDPSKPEEVGRWWIPGQWKDGGEEYPWANWTPPRCHHPMRRGDRLYVSYWHHGYYILDISDMSRPKAISGGNTSPTFPHPTHTCLPMPQKLKGRDVMVVGGRGCGQAVAGGARLHVDLRHHERAMPIPISTWQVEGLDKDGAPQPAMMGCHQPSERFKGTVIPFAWFAQGLRLIDIADPFAPKEVGFYETDAPQGFDLASSNDVTIDDRGLLYLIDRQRGVDIIETSVM